LRKVSGLIGGIDPKDVSETEATEPQNIEAFRQILGLANSEVHQWGGELEFVYLPSFADFGNHRSVGKNARQQVLALVRGLGIGIIDVEPTFEMSGGRSLFPFAQPGHYNATGHRVVADTVLARLPSHVLH